MANAPQQFQPPLGETNVTFFLCRQWTILSHGTAPSSHISFYRIDKPDPKADTLAAKEHFLVAYFQGHKSF